MSYRSIKIFIKKRFERLNNTNEKEQVKIINSIYEDLSKEGVKDSVIKRLIDNVIIENIQEKVKKIK